MRVNCAESMNIAAYQELKTQTAIAFGSLMDPWSSRLGS